MSLTEKIDVLELLIELLKEHDNKLDSLVEKIEIIDQTIRNDPRLSKSLKQHNPKNMETPIAQRILVVDDDENLANSFQLILRSVGYNVDTAYMGLQALDMIDEEKYDLILLDLNLPDIMGSDLAMEIAENHEDIKIVYITGHSSLKPDDEKETLLKPIKPEHLIETTTKNLDIN